MLHREDLGSAHMDDPRRDGRDGGAASSGMKTSVVQRTESSAGGQKLKDQQFPGGGR